ncbi:hypothetical protein [Streptomyces sp. C36]|uniref:hypothetical protein n=1 Tax=Streptomyces sp. C36 TaxID=3237122 RepID=UPI0034C6D7EC
MARRQKQSRKPRPAIRMGPIDTMGIAEQLRALHEAGGDPALERFPDPGELYLVLRHAERQASSLPEEARGAAAVLRAKLWQYLREQADAGQLRAVDDGRGVGVPWQSFNEALCVTTRHGAYQKALRLKAEQVRQPHERRSPETAHAYEERRLTEEKAENLRVTAQARRFALAQRIARRLLEHRDGLVVDEMAEYWLDELAETVDDRNSAFHRANFCGFLESFVRSIHQHARDHNQPTTTTDDARKALALATEFAVQERPTIPQ